MGRWTLALALLATAVGPAAARRLPDWPYEKLFREADLVVLARPVSSAGSGDATKDNLWKVEFVGVNTRFNILAVLKGKAAGGPLTVLHYRLPDGVQVEDGPTLVSFRLRGLFFTTKTAKFGLGRPDYLLFLKRRADGRYEPVSGTVDPELSVREVTAPLPARLGRPDADAR